VRVTLLFFGYLLVCFALAAVLTVPLMHAGWLDVPPHRLMARLAQLFMLLGCVPLLWALGLWCRATLGYAVPRFDLTRALAGGWLLGVGMMSVVVALLLGCGARVWSASWPTALAAAIASMPAALLGGGLIALIEETFFRGALFGAIRRHGGLMAAAGWSACLYASVHFLKPRALPVADAFDSGDAFEMFVSAFTAAWQWHHLDSWLALLLAGLLLAAVRERTGHLGWCIGLHAGWVFVIQIARRLTDGNDTSPWRWFAGDYDGVIGLLAAAWLGVLLLAFWMRPGPARLFSSSRRG